MLASTRSKWIRVTASWSIGSTAILLASEAESVLVSALLGWVAICWVLGTGWWRPSGLHLSAACFAGALGGWAVANSPWVGRTPLAFSAVAQWSLLLVLIWALKKVWWLHRHACAGCLLLVAFCHLLHESFARSHGPGMSTLSEPIDKLGPWIVALALGGVVPGLLMRSSTRPWGRVLSATLLLGLGGRSVVRAAEPWRQTQLEAERGPSAERLDRLNALFELRAALGTDPRHFDPRSKPPWQVVASPEVAALMAYHAQLPVLHASPSGRPAHLRELQDLRTLLSVESLWQIGTVRGRSLRYLAISPESARWVESRDGRASLVAAMLDPSLPGAAERLAGGTCVWPRPGASGESPFTVWEITTSP